MLTTAIAPGHWLAPDAAASYARMRAAGMPAGITSAGRDPARQIELFLSRYRVQWVGRGPYGDVRWWQGRRYVRHSAAGMVAVPGTSRHETGLALDLPNTGPRMWLTIHGAAHGWVRNIPSEPWHFEYRAERDQYRTAPTPTPPTWLPEEDDMPLTPDDLARIVAAVAPVIRDEAHRAAVGVMRSEEQAQRTKRAVLDALAQQQKGTQP